MKHALMIVGPSQGYGTTGRHLTFSTFQQVVGQKERPREGRDNNLYHHHSVLLYDGMTLETIFSSMRFGLAAPKARDARTEVKWDADGGLIVTASMFEPPKATIAYQSLGEHLGHQCILIHKPFLKEGDFPDTAYSIRQVPIFGTRGAPKAFNWLRRMIAGENNPSGIIHCEDERDRWLKLDLLDVFYNAALVHNKDVLTEKVDEEDDEEEV